MKWSLSISGGEELAQRLIALSLAVSRRILIAALKEAAEPIRARAEMLAPVSSRGGPHLNDNVMIQQVSRVGSVQGGAWVRNDIEPWVAVGPAKPFFYGIFQEYGTKFQSAQPFMRPAFQSGGAEALAILSGRIWAALERKLPSSSSTSPAIAPFARAA